MPQLFTNNATSTIVGALGSGTATITVQTGDGAKFPSPSGVDFAILTLTQADAESTWEEVTLTARSGDVLTVTRGTEGAASVWSDGDKIELRITAGYLNSLAYLDIPIISKSADYTFAIGDRGKSILHPSADTVARTFTIPAFGAVQFAIGTAITIINQASAGVISIASAADTLRLSGLGSTGSRTIAANGIATIVKITASEWMISGIGVT